MSDQQPSSPESDQTVDKHRQTSHTATLMASTDEVYVGDTMTLRGRNLPANEPLTLVWHTKRGHWGIFEGSEVVGPQFQPRTTQLATVTTDEDGSFTVDLEVPEDYGGTHTIELQTVDEESLAQTKVQVTPWFELEGSTAPLGGTFTITGYGLGPDVVTSNYQVTWDNGMVGYMTGTMNRGTATAEIRAAGPVGKHHLQVWRNVNGIPFLQNNTQSRFGPVAGGRQSNWVVEVTEPESEPESAWMDPLVEEDPLQVHFPDVDVDTGAELSITPSSGQPGTTAFIRGEQFPANQRINLVWYTHKGNSIAGEPTTTDPRPDILPTVTTDDDGSFEAEVTIPRGRGATRPIAAVMNGKTIAVTGFMMQPKIVDITPTKGPVGTEIEIELTGIGWTRYDNTYFFTYDNRPLGEICGSDVDVDDGVVRFKIHAAGEPGYHFIDAYPNIFEMHEEVPRFTHKPHLSYKHNHPVRRLPAAHFAFEVTE